MYVLRRKNSSLRTVQCLGGQKHEQAKKSTCFYGTTSGCMARRNKLCNRCMARRHDGQTRSESGVSLALGSPDPGHRFRAHGSAQTGGPVEGPQTFHSNHTQTHTPPPLTDRCSEGNYYTKQFVRRSKKGKQNCETQVNRTNKTKKVTYPLPLLPKQTTIIRLKKTEATAGTTAAGGVTIRHQARVKDLYT